VPCFRVLVSGVRNPKALQRPWVSEPNVSTVCCPPQAEERRTNQLKRAMRPLQGSSAKIEIAFRIPPLRHNNPGCPLWVSRVIAIRNDGERTRGGRGKRGKCQPGGLSGEAGNAPSLLARKGERNPLQGFRATIERTVSNPATSTPGSVDFPTLPGFLFWRICRFFPVCNLPGCSGMVRHSRADSKMPFP